MFFEQLAVIGTQSSRDSTKIFLQFIQNALQTFLIFHPAVQLMEHLVRVINRSNRLVGTGIDHATPGIRAIGDHHAEFQRSKSRTSFRTSLQIVLDFLIDRQTTRPTCGGV